MCIFLRRTEGKINIASTKIFYRNAFFLQIYFLNLWQCACWIFQISNATTLRFADAIMLLRIATAILCILGAEGQIVGITNVLFFIEETVIQSHVLYGHRIGKKHLKYILYYKNIICLSRCHIIRKIFFKCFFKFGAMW